MSTAKKLIDKAARLDFSKLPGLEKSEDPSADSSSPIPPESYRPKTAPGAMMAYAADARSELIRENELLKTRVADTDLLRSKVSELSSDLAQWDGAKATRLLDPTRIRRSKWANRHDDSYLDPEFQSLKEELSSSGGNVQPIKVRQVARDDEGDLFEIVFGHRRHQGCLELGLPVLALLESVTDHDLFVEMDRENRARKNLSPWEQGKMYLRALEEGLFPSQRKLAEAVGIDLSALGKSLSLARLPIEVVQAFPSPLEIQFRWAKPLADALVEDSTGVLERAIKIATAAPKPKAKVIFEFLVKGTSPGGGTVPPPVETTALKVNGKLIGNVSVAPQGAVTIQFKPGFVQSKQVDGLVKLLTEYFRRT